VTDDIKSLAVAEIQGNDSNIGVGSKGRGDCMKDGNKDTSGGASRTKRKLIMKGKCEWGGRRAGYMYLCTISYSNILVRTGLIDWSKVSVCCWSGYFWNRSNISLFPL